MLELLVLVLVLVPVLGSEGTMMNHASASSKVSAMSSGSGVRGSARGKAILTTCTRMVSSSSWYQIPGEAVAGADTGRSGQVGGPGAQVGLLIPLRGPLPEARDGGGKIEYARGRAGGRRA